MILKSGLCRFSSFQNVTQTGILTHCGPIKNVGYFGVLSGPLAFPLFADTRLVWGTLNRQMIGSFAVNQPECVQFLGRFEIFSSIQILSQFLDFSIIFTCDSRHLYFDWKTGFLRLDAAKLHILFNPVLYVIGSLFWLLSSEGVSAYFLQKHLFLTFSLCRMQIWNADVLVFHRFLAFHSVNSIIDERRQLTGMDWSDSLAPSPEIIGFLPDFVRIWRHPSWSLV